MPLKHTGFGEDISPELCISNPPDGTKFYAISFDDMDVPFAKSFNHWLIWNIPCMDIIPEGLPKGGIISEPINACQGNAWGKNVYRGLKQPFFIRNEHRYVFTVYALDCKLDISEKSCKNELLEAINGHVLAEASITVKYKR